VRDPLGGINSLWPLFGIANQLLAAIALCLGTTIILKTMLRGRDGTRSRPSLALVTLIPLAWLLSVTMTAGLQKILHPDPKIGFLAAAHQLGDKVPALKSATNTADPAAYAAAERALKDNIRQIFNMYLDAIVAGTFLTLVALIVSVSVREWILLLARRKAPQLQETEPVWLPPNEAVTAEPTGAFGAAALAFALVREISGQAAIDRIATVPETPIVVHVRRNVLLSEQPLPKRDAAAPYLAALEHRYSRITRCC